MVNIRLQRTRWLLSSLGVLACLALTAAAALLGYHQITNVHSRTAGQGGVTFAVSRDGSKIAFNAAGRGGSDLYLLDLRSSHVRRLTDTPDYELSPRFSPDGRSLVYAAGRPGDRADHLFLRPVSGLGTAARQLTYGDANDCSPDFSPDGTRIVFTRDRHYTWGGLAANWGGGGSLWVMQRDGTDLHRLGAASLYAYAPHWFGHGSALNILYHDRAGVSLLPDNGSAPPKIVAPAGQDAVPSPDAHRMALSFFQGQYSGSSQIQIAPLHGGVARSIASSPDGCFHPVFAPDGTHVYYLAESWPNGRSGEPKENLWRVGIDGTGLRQVADYHLFDAPLRWHP
jgi:Tol biopolymer transport system component